ncbi:hypothetical protein [Rhabdothermincola salaria]|uniref:hypothetical protein n=1 Tax=Rhabdothermincola salaria TaxID=2903142 RepID=UPI001E63C093|nr:hypothetical protein [Rhabdothermincola salaria]MCD9622783.1 hypothetical protein [Rhabdothermincola salaria]
MSFPGDQEPPRYAWYDLDEALELLAVLEDARDALTDSRHLAVVITLEAQIRTSAIDSTSTTRREAPMPTEALRASEAARRLGIPTKDLLRLIHDRMIRYVMIDGIAHVPVDAIDDYRTRVAS